MMFNPPFFGSPFYRRLPPPYYPTPEPTPPPIEKNSNSDIPKQNCATDTQNNATKKRNSTDNNSQIFNIAGITLYFDDILIICLLFFLYSEGVKDEMLFISLILLLLS